VNTIGRRSRHAIAACAVLAAATMAAGTAHGGAGDGRLEVIARGLDNPRGLAFDRRGVLYVAEAGRGGDGPCNVGPGGEAFCVGATGAVTAVRDGRQRRVVSGLPSYGNQTRDFVLGPSDVVPAGAGALHIPIGFGNEPAARAELGRAGANLGRLVRASRGRWRPTADIARYELEHNPDRANPTTTIETNPNAVLHDGGRTYVVDAAGNSMLAVRGAGTIATVAVFPDQRAPTTGEWLDAVPTAVARGRDGAFYVSQLVGFPWPPGEARIFRVLPSGRPTVHAGGFTNVIDLAFDASGRLLVLEIATNGLLSDDPVTGALKRVEPDGSVTLLARDGLVNPTGVVVGPDRALYVTNGGRSPGGGEVLRLRPPT